jgi:hydrogenase/urease accessory protein HupE
VGILFAFIGTYFGKKLLNKTTISGIQRVVGVLLIVYGLLFLVGVL